MFWNGKALSDALCIRGELYSNLFAYSLSDLHSYNSSGKIIKTNCYSTFFDLISGKGNTPAVFKNYAKKLIQKFESAKSSKSLYNDVKNINVDQKIYVTDLLNRVKDSEFVSGGVRAEFRVKLSDFYSLALALNCFLNEEKMKQLTFVFESSKVVNLSSMYIQMINKQISTNILQLMSGIEQSLLPNHLTMERISTISVLESLLSTTLFSGLTYSFGGPVVWNKSSVERRSLELMKYIRELDRPVFGDEFFENSVFKISASEDILNTIFSKIFKSRVFNFPPVDLMIRFNNSNLSDQQKANILWEIYFQELNPNAFLSSSPLPRWKLASLNSVRISMISSLLSFRGTVNAIFNFDSFANYGSWKNRYYMKLANQWLEESSGQISKDILISLLVQGVKDLGIEHIHYVGGEEYNSRPDYHVPVNINDLTDTEKYAEIIRERNIEGQSDEDEESIRRREIQRMHEIRNRNRRVKSWEYEELSALFRGVVKYGCKWKKILSDNSFYFKNNRDNTALSQKWNNLKKEGIVIYNEATKKWSVPDRYHNEYPSFEYDSSTLNLLTFISASQQPRRQNQMSAPPRILSPPIVQESSRHVYPDETDHRTRVAVEPLDEQEIMNTNSVVFGTGHQSIINPDLSQILASHSNNDLMTDNYDQILNDYNDTLRLLNVHNGVDINDGKFKINLKHIYFIFRYL